MLPSGPGRAVSIDPQVALVDLHLVGHLVEERHHLERGKCGLAFTFLIEG